MGNALIGHKPKGRRKFFALRPGRICIEPSAPVFKVQQQCFNKANRQQDGLYRIFTNSVPDSCRPLCHCDFCMIFAVFLSWFANADFDVNRFACRVNTVHCHSNNIFAHVRPFDSSVFYFFLRRRRNSPSSGSGTTQHRMRYASAPAAIGISPRIRRIGSSGSHGMLLRTK